MKKILYLLIILFGWTSLIQAQVSGSIQTQAQDYNLVTESQYTVIQHVTPPLATVSKYAKRI